MDNYSLFRNYNPEVLTGSPLPKTYQPKILRQERPAQDRELTYAIGEEHEPRSFGMWHGPNPSLNNMLEVVGESEKSTIVRFNPDWTDESLYKWHVENKRWELVPENQR